MGTDLPGSPASCTPGVGDSRTTLTSIPLCPVGASQRTARPGGPPAPHFFVPVKALSPISRALFKEDMRHAGLLEHIDPQVWTIPWNVHSQAKHHGPSAFSSLAPYVFKVAISNHRLVRLTAARSPSPPGKSAVPASAPPPSTDGASPPVPQHVLPDGVKKFATAAFSMPVVPSRSQPSASCSCRATPARPGRRAPAPTPLRGPLSELWRPDVRRHATLDLPQAPSLIPAERHEWPWRAACKHGYPPHGTRAPTGRPARQPAQDGNPTTF